MGAIRDYYGTPEGVVASIKAGVDLAEISSAFDLELAAAKQLEFETAAKLRDQLGVLRQQWSDMHSAGDSKLKKPASTKSRKRTGPKSKS